MDISSTAYCLRWVSACNMCSVGSISTPLSNISVCGAATVANRGPKPWQYRPTHNPTNPRSSDTGCWNSLHDSVSFTSLTVLRDQLELLILVTSWYIIMFNRLISGSIVRSANCRHLSYSEADFEVFRAPMGVKFGTPPCQISPLSVQRQGCIGPPKLKFLLWFNRNVEYKRRVPLGRYS